MDSKNKRKYYRTPIRLPARWRPLRPQESALVEQGMGMSLFRRRETPGPIEDLMESAAHGSSEEKLYRSLQHINNKLDFIIDQIFFKDSDDTTYADHVVELSGSGLRFESRRCVQPGVVIRMDLVIPETCRFSVQLIAEVSRVDQGGDGDFLTAAKILDIEEADRDAIVQIVFQKQRREIRSTKSSRGEDSRAG